MVMGLSRAKSLRPSGCDIAHKPPICPTKTVVLCGSVLSLGLRKRVACGVKWTSICTHDKFTEQSFAQLGRLGRPVQLDPIKIAQREKARGGESITGDLLPV